jgi:predicted nucleic acid-binding protein
MPTLIDTSLWIDLTRARSPQPIKQFVASYILHPDAHLAEPVAFEILRHAKGAEVRQIQQQFQALPMLATPADLWTQATQLGQACRQKGFNVASLDLLIAAIAIHHGAELITFDGDFQHIAAVSGLQVNVLVRPTP